MPPHNASERKISRHSHAGSLVAGARPPHTPQSQLARSGSTRARCGAISIFGKRQVKAPKIYFRDSGLLHSLLGIGDAAALARHPKSGSSWEGFALDQVLRIARPDEAYFWATHAGAELDLLMIKDGRRVGVEFKRADAPQMTPSMRLAALVT